MQPQEKGSILIRMRHPAEAEHLVRAIAGERDSADLCLRFISSANSNLQRIMKEAVHDLNQLELWQHLLNCLVFKHWDAGGKLPDCSRRDDPKASERIDEAIIELFTYDDIPGESSIKTRLLWECQRSPEQAKQNVTACLLGLRGETDAIPAIQRAIETGDPATCLLAVRALRKLAIPECAHALVLALAQDREVVHQAARLALVELGARANDAWKEALKHPNSHIRWHAAHGLSHTKDSSTLQILAEGLYDENHGVRWATANTLAELGTVAVPAILELLCKQPITESYRQAAYHALHAMNSKDAREKLKPLLEALNGSAAAIAAPTQAQKLFATWNL